MIRHILALLAEALFASIFSAFPAFLRCGKARLSCPQSRREFSLRLALVFLKHSQKRTFYALWTTAWTSLSARRKTSRYAPMHRTPPFRRRLTLAESLRLERIRHVFENLPHKDSLLQQPPPAHPIASPGPRRPPASAIAHTPWRSAQRGSKRRLPGVCAMFFSSSSASGRPRGPAAQPSRLKGLNRLSRLRAPARRSPSRRCL